MNEWSEEELTAAVDAYRRMEAQLNSNSKIDKASVYRELASRHGRTPKAWEYRMQNISHVLAQADEEWLPGLRPAANVGPRAEAILARLLSQSNSAVGLVDGTTRKQLAKEVRLAEAAGSFSPADATDDRQRVLATIVRRRGQPAFRKALIEAYGGRCAMTGCDAVDALEAAHIHPYLGPASNAASNGLLLRSDIHTLFDLYLVTVDPNSLKIAVAPALRQSTYGELAGAELMAPAMTRMAVSLKSLTWHRSQCSWT